MNAGTAEAPRLAKPAGLFSGQRLFAAVFTVLAVLQLALFWSVKYPPQVDLPQHAAQITLWRLLDEPFYAARYEWNGFTPYLLCYVAGRLFDLFLPVKAAFGVFTSLALLALPLSLLFVLRRRGGDPWWSLLGFPLSFSFSFYWGLLNFLAAVPLALVVMALAFSWARRPTPWRGVILALLGVVLFLTHGLVCAFTLLVAGSVILATAPQPRRAVWGQLPLLPAAATGMAWFLAARSAEDQVQSAPAWNPGWSRLFELPATLLGDPTDAVAAVVGTLLLIMVISAGLGGATRRGEKRRRIGWRIARWLPLAWALLFYFLGPEIYFRAAFFNARFAVFLLPCVLLALRVPARRWQRAALVALALSWLLVLFPRFQDFDREARRIDPVLEAMEPGKAAMGIVYDPFPEAIGTPAFLHHFAWYQAEKGGLVDFSFAYFYVQLIRYRPEHQPRVPDAFSWRPETFDRRAHSGYDYWIVRSAENPATRLFGERPPAVALRVHSGKWWLYERSPWGE